MPLHRGAAGKIILAQLPARYVGAFYQEHAAEMAEVALGHSWEEAKRALRRIRTAGVVEARAELDPGVFGIAAPLFAPDSGVIGSVATAIPDADPPRELVERVSRALRRGTSKFDAAFAAAVTPAPPNDGSGVA